MLPNQPKPPLLFQKRAIKEEEEEDINYCIKSTSDEVLYKLADQGTKLPYNALKTPLHLNKIVCMVKLFSDLPIKVTVFSSSSFHFINFQTAAFLRNGKY